MDWSKTKIQKTRNVFVYKKSKIFLDILIGILAIGLILIIILSVQQTELKISVNGNSKVISSIQLPIDKNEAEKIVKEFCEPENPDYMYDYRVMKKIDNEWRIQIININGMCYAVVNVKSGETNCTKCSNTKMFPPFENQVIITTDKTEYEQGEMVEITFDNNKPEPIYVYFEGCRHFTEPIGYVRESVQRFWNMNKFEDGKWRKLITNFDLYDDIFCYTDSAGWDTTLKEFKSPVVVKWNQTTCTDYLRKASEAVTSGKFKVEFCYFDEKDVSITEKEVYNEKLNKNITVKLFQGAPEKKKCIEKEFMIKEKSALDPRCGEKVKGRDCNAGAGICTCKGWSLGYEFDSNKGKCVEKTISCCRNCRSVEIPFKTLEECQEVCEKKETI